MDRVLDSPSDRDAWSGCCPGGHVLPDFTGDPGAEEHPSRRIKVLVNAALKGLSALFDELYAVEGRPSIPPARLLKAKVLQAPYTIRSETLLIEVLDYNLCPAVSST